MTNWTIARRLISAFAAIIALSFGFGIFALSNVSGTKRNTSEMAANRFPATVALYEIQGQLTRNYGRLTTLLLSPVDQRGRIAADMATASQQIDITFHTLDTSIVSIDERAMFDALKAHREEFDKVTLDIIETSTAGHYDAAVAKVPARLTPIFDEIVDEDIDHLAQLNRRKAEVALAEINNSVGNGVNGVIFGVICEIISVGVIGWFLVRGITRALTRLANGMNDGANQVAAAANQVSDGSQTLAEGASEQAASLEETSSSMEQMSSMTRRNSENALQANDIAKQTRATAEKGANDMAAMSVAMEAIKASSDDIAKIIKTIDEIAFQTNILALNAAVEAARAGEAGMGFAVVADEVRNLAQRSAEAAKETAAKIEGAITKSGQGVEISNKVAKTLNEIVIKSRKMDELVAEVAAASREQTEGIAQINSAIGQMDKVTQGNSASAERSASAAQELNSQAGKIKDSVNELLGLVGAVERDAVVDFRSSPVKIEQAPPKIPAAKRPATSVPSRSDPAPSLGATRTVISRRNEIPLDGEFKNF
jgi:methyl-accepting chemotaxis protein